MLAALGEDPECHDRLHRFDEVSGLDLCRGALIVVHLQGSVAAPWPGAHESDSPMAYERWSKPLPAGILVPPLQAHSWLPEALPPPDTIARWTRLSATTGEKLAYWWWWERGDELYADVAWLFAPTATALLVRETIEVASEERAFRYTSAPERAPLDAAPLQAAMKHLGFQSSLQYFVPAESWRFDWAPYRVTGR
ncbi:MAG: hypothetical protein QM820_53325 [Minicystis sp.]